jgi:hypothetical protein
MPATSPAPVVSGVSVIPAIPGETWLAVNSALDVGVRGLPGGSSLASVLHQHRGVRHRGKLPRLTVKQIQAWAQEHRKRTGRNPSPDSRPIAAAPGETWKAVHVALCQGLRGLPGGSTLASVVGPVRQPGTPRRRTRVTGSMTAGDATDRHRSDTDNKEKRRLHFAPTRSILSRYAGTCKHLLATLDPGGAAAAYAQFLSMMRKSTTPGTWDR